MHPNFDKLRDLNYKFSFYDYIPSVFIELYSLMPVSLIVCQDVESYDPILNPVLNREVRRTGGRVLITLGDQDIDLSPSFVIFLSTRDPTVMLSCFTASVRDQSKQGCRIC